MDNISTLSPASELDIKSIDLFDRLKTLGWIERKNDQWILTKTGRLHYKIMGDTDEANSMWIYESRLCEIYRNELLAQIKRFTVFNRRVTEKEWEELRAELPSGKEKGKVYTKKIKNKTYPHCLRIDFSGFSASTLLNTNQKIEDETPKLNQLIAISFEELLREKNCRKLNRNGIFIKIRFLFAYLYSEFPFSLMKAQHERKRPLIDGKFRATYDFKDEPGLTTEQFDIATLKSSQKTTLNALQTLFNDNSHLKPTLHYLELNTMQVRFTPLPIAFCMLLINRIAYMDSYIYAQKFGVKQLSYRYPLIKIDLKRNGEHYSNINNHFDYMWHHDLTLIADDCTEFLKKSSKGLSTIKLPHQITWSEKKKIIKNYLVNKKVSKENYSIAKQKEWEVNIKHRFAKTTKLPFDYKEINQQHVTILFTDFVNFTEVSADKKAKAIVKELDECYSQFDAICDENNLKRIKTIGDAYLCVAGLDEDDFKKPALNAVKAANQMISFISKRNNNKKIKYYEGIRIGLNSGYVALKIEQSEIDIFGKEVNLASRMEHYSEIGKINISFSTHDLIKGKIKCKEREKQIIKGFGEHIMWFVK